MENASKALIIAGGVLIGVLILALANNVLFKSSETAREFYDTLSKEQLIEFNNKFEIFRDSTKATTQDIVSLINLIKEYNSKNNEELQISIKVKEKIGSIIPINENSLEEQLIEFIKENTLDDESNKQMYKCENIEYTDYFEIKVVNYIEFKKI